MTVLAIETSCDETAVAILQGDTLRASEVSSQSAAHRSFGGVVPEFASRNHLHDLPGLLDRAFRAAGLDSNEIDIFAATTGPGLASSLLVGSSTAKGLAIGAGKPFLPVNHLEGHLLSPFFGKSEIEPNVSLIVSGGHTLLVHVRAFGDYEILGRTLDDAAGEAFDKVAKMLGLGYPGGPEVELRARDGNPSRFDLPRPMLKSDDLNFSFSGVKTAVRYLLPKLIRGTKETAFDPAEIADVCASFQAAVIEVLRAKSLRAVREARVRRLTLSGGVSCNQALREDLRNACAAADVGLLVAEPWLSTDNAAMIAFAAMQKAKRGIHSSLTAEIDPNLALA